MDSKTHNELISRNKTYQLVTERLDIPSVGTGENLAESLQLNNELIELILDLYDSENDPEFSYLQMRKFSIREILNYLQASHRFYLTKKIPEIEQSLLHIFSKYGQTHSLLASLALFFNDYKNKLIAHFRMEEREFFPYIKKLIKASNGEMTPDAVTDLLNNNSIDSFNENHDPIEDELQEVREIISKHSDQKSTPLPYRVFLNQVEIFEQELRKHAIIEDHVLVPMALELEKKLKEAAC